MVINGKHSYSFFFGPIKNPQWYEADIYIKNFYFKEKAVLQKV